MAKLVVEEGTIQPSRPTVKLRGPVQLQPITDTRPIHPKRSGFNQSQGFALEEFGAFATNELGEPLSGYERHICSMVDQGLASADDLL